MTTPLRSGLAVPLDGVDGLVVGLTLCQADADAFTSDHLRILQVITSEVGHFVENALKYRHAEDSATSNFLTGLPNSQALSMHLDQELARLAKLPYCRLSIRKATPAIQRCAQQAPAAPSGVGIIRDGQYSFV